MSEYIEIRESNSVDGYFAVEIVQKELVRNGHLEGLKPAFEEALRVACLKGTTLKYKGREYNPCIEITDPKLCRTVAVIGKRIAEAVAIGIYAENTREIGIVHGKVGEPEWRVEREYGNDEENAVRLKLIKKEVKK